MIFLLDYVHNHYREDLRMADYAKVVGYTPRHMNVLFKNCLGETFGSYLRSLRMETAKKDLESGIPVADAGKKLSFQSKSGFRKTFKDYYGVSPKDFVSGRVPVRKYEKRYDYRDSVSCSGWGRGSNPTPDGLWEFGYYDPKTEEYRLMHWEGKLRRSQAQEYRILPYSGQFEAPYDKEAPSDLSWYCNHRFWGYGMHPGSGLRSVRSFVCPYGGSAVISVSAGRICDLRQKDTPCSLQLFLNGTPVSPTKEPIVLSDTQPVHLRGELSVNCGDRISLHLDAMGDNHCDGIVIYRQRIDYVSLDSHE